MAAGRAFHTALSGCACDEPPEACGRPECQRVAAGWKYVQLERGLAMQLRLVPGTRRLVAELLRSTVSPHDLEGVGPSRCPL